MTECEGDVFVPACDAMMMVLILLPWADQQTTSGRTGFLLRAPHPTLQEVRGGITWRVREIIVRVQEDGKKCRWRFFLESKERICC